MGGAETLRAAPSHLELFAYIGVFSMGLQTGQDAGMNSDFEERNASFFAHPDKTNELVKLLYVASGVEMRSSPTGPGGCPRRSRSTASIMNFTRRTADTRGSTGASIWYDFAPKLFL